MVSLISLGHVKPFFYKGFFVYESKRIEMTSKFVAVFEDYQVISKAGSVSTSWTLCHNVITSQSASKYKDIN